MTTHESDYTAWVETLVKVSLPLDLQKKIITLQPLTKEEAQKFMDVVLLVSQAKGLNDHREIISKLDDLKGSVNSLNSKSNIAASIRSLILWYASGNDPRYKPRDNRTVSAIKNMMVQEGLAMLAKDASLSERSAADILVRKYGDIPGAYTDVEVLRRQINRKNKLGK